MASVTESIDVAVPVSTAYNQWTQFETFPKFMDGAESTQQVDDRRLHWQIKIGGVQREFDAEIVEQHPDERVAWRSTDGTTNAGVVTFHRLSDTSSRVTAQIDWNPEGLAEKAGATIGVDDHRIKQDLARFKEFIEDRGRETGAWRGDVQAPNSGR